MKLCKQEVNLIRKQTEINKQEVTTNKQEVDKQEVKTGSKQLVSSHLPKHQRMCQRLLSAQKGTNQIVGCFQCGMLGRVLHGVGRELPCGLQAPLQLLVTGFGLACPLVHYSGPVCVCVCVCVWVYVYVCVCVEVEGEEEAKLVR